MMIMEFLEKLSDALYYIDGYSPLSASEWHLAPQKYKRQSVTKQNLSYIVGKRLWFAKSNPHHYPFWAVQLYIPKTFALLGIFEPEIIQCHDQAVIETLHKLAGCYLIGENEKTPVSEPIISKLDYRFKGKYPWRHSVILIVNSSQEGRNRAKPLDYDYFFKNFENISDVYHDSLRALLIEKGYPVRTTLRGRFEHETLGFITAENSLKDMRLIDPAESITPEDEYNDAFFKLN